MVFKIVSDIEKDNYLKNIFIIITFKKFKTLYRVLFLFYSQIINSK